MKNKGGRSQSEHNMNVSIHIDNLSERNCKRLFCANSPVVENRFDVCHKRVAEF